MVQTRAVEDRMVAMYKGGDLLGSLYTGHWHEAISVGAAAALRPDDYMAPIHRDLGAHLWRGMESWQVMASFMGKATSPTGGRDGTLHYGRLDLGFYNLPSHIPANFPVAIGMAFAAKYRGEDKVCLAFCGDGSTSRADFHESVNIASVHEAAQRLRDREQPVRLFHSDRAADRFGGLRLQGRGVRHPRGEGGRHRRARGVRRGRRGRGPRPQRRGAHRWSRRVTMRMHGHAEHDPADYVPKELFEEWGKKDPVELFEKALIEGGVIDEAYAKTGQRKDARSMPSPPGARRSRTRCPIQARSRMVSMPTESSNGSVTYLEAIGQALMAEMEADPDVFLIGEDVGQFGGAFKVTKGFLEKFGPRRVVDTPIAETGFTGLAAGAALVGLRPIVEFQFADFISCAFDPIINVLARHYYRTGDPMPVTMRAPFGARLRAGPDTLAERGVLLRARARAEDRDARHRRRTPPVC